MCIRDRIGTIGGGSVENAAYEKALELIKQEKSYIESYDLSNSVAAKLGTVSYTHLTLPTSDLV